MTADKSIVNDYSCPGEGILKLVTGKWKPQIFKLATEGPMRFNNILHKLPGARKQSISVALR
jgi:DNA-binding HxlR family transcriptional regulator